MPDLTISDLKRALVEVQRHCKEADGCAKCYFREECGAICNTPPCVWYLEEEGKKCSK